MSKQPTLSDYSQLAKDHELKFISNPSLKEPFLAIVNLKDRSLSVVSRRKFCKKRSIIWAEDVINASPPETEKEKQALQQARECWKALLQTDYGFGVINLREIKQDSYVSAYEGYFFDSKNSPAPQLQKPEYDRAVADITYNLSFIPEGSAIQSAHISAGHYRGFGGFMQHLPNEIETKAYQLTPGCKEKMAVENISRVKFKNRVLFKAKTDIPPLSPLGFSYSSYWYGRNQMPVLFNQLTGFSIPQDHYRIVRYFIKFTNTQFSEEEDQYYSIEEFKSLSRLAYSCIDNLIFKPEHLDAIRDPKHKAAPRFLYSKVLISNLTGHDYMRVADDYFVGHDPSEMKSPHHLKQVITYYQRAEQLFSNKNQLALSSRCQKMIIAYQKALKPSGTADGDDSKGEALLLKYKSEVEKILPDKDVAFRRAAAAGNIDDLRRLLFLGAAVNSQGSPSKKTALHQAAIKGHLNAFMLLLSLADPGIKDKSKKTAFDYVKLGSPIHKVLSSFDPSSPSPPVLLQKLGY